MSMRLLPRDPSTPRRVRAEVAQDDERWMALVD